MTEHPDLDYQDDKHLYIEKTTGKPVVSVTEVTGQVNIYEGIDKETLNNAATRGKYIHAACDLLDENNLDWESLSPVLVPYVQAWSDFRAATRYRILQAEQVVFHNLLKYAGRLDRVLEIDQKRVLVDIKTSWQLSDVYGMQLAAYTEALGSNQIIDKLIVIQLKKDGRYTVKDYTEDRRIHWESFLTCLKFYRVKQSYTKIKKENPYEN